MGEWGPLFGILLAFYLAECLAPVGTGAVLFRSQAGGPCRPVHLAPAAFLRRGRRGLVPAHLLPFGRTVVIPAPEGSLDAVQAGERTRLLKEASAWPRASCTILFAYGFGLLPAAALGWIRAPWQALAGGYLLILAWVQVSVFLAHRKLHPDRRADRFKQLAYLLVSPADALHAADQLARHALPGTHPLAAARALCDEAGYAAFARKLLREARHGAAEGAFQRLEAAVRAQGLDPGALLAPPAAQPGCRSYCPRCEQQFVLATGLCPDCRGVALTPL